MPKAWPDYTLEELRTHATKTFREGGGSRPDVFLIEINGQQAVLKDQNGADKVFAKFIGPILNWRECKALKKLENSRFTPQLLAQPDGRSFLMSYHESEQITRLDKISIEWPVFFERLKFAIEDLHKFGVAHNDLRNPTNILVNNDGEPILVDMVACFCRGQKWNIANRWLFEKFAQVDKSAIRKLKGRVAPELIDEQDIDARDIAGRPGMWIKSLGQVIRKISRKFFTN